MQATVGRGLRVVAGPHPIEVDHAAVERQGLERRLGLGRDPLAERLGERQPVEVALQRHPAGVQVDGPAEPQAIEDVALGRALEPIDEAPGLLLLDPDRHLVEDRRDAGPVGGGTARPRGGLSRRVGRARRAVVVADQLDASRSRMTIGGVLSSQGPGQGSASRPWRFQVPSGR